jgi:hypothetical protein
LTSLRVARRSAVEPCPAGGAPGTAVDRAASGANSRAGLSARLDLARTESRLDVHRLPHWRRPSDGLGGR